MKKKNHGRALSMDDDEMDDSVTFSCSGKVIVSTRSSDQIDTSELAQHIPQLGKRDSQVSIFFNDKRSLQQALSNKLTLKLPPLDCTTEIAKERYKEAERWNLKLKHLQNELKSARKVIRKVMDRLNARMSLVNVGPDVLCKIFEYCNALPIQTLGEGGMDAFRKEMKKNYSKVNDQRLREYDKQGNLTPLYFSLVCKSFADAMNRKPPVLLLRTKTKLPSIEWLSKIVAVSTLFVDTTSAVLRTLASTKYQNNAKALYHPYHLIIDGRRSTQSIADLLSIMQPRQLTLMYLSHVPLLPPLNTFISKLSVCKPHWRTRFVVKENLLDILQNSPSIAHVHIDATTVTRHFLEGVLELEHVKEVHCPNTLTDIKTEDLPTLIEKYIAKDKSIQVGAGFEYEYPASVKQYMPDYIRPTRYSYIVYGFQQDTLSYTDAIYNKVAIMARSLKAEPNKAKKQVQRQIEDYVFSSDSEDDGTARPAKRIRLT